MKYKVMGFIINDLVNNLHRFNRWGSFLAKNSELYFVL